MGNRLGKTAFLLGTVVAKAIWNQVKDTDFVKQKKEALNQKLEDLEASFFKWAKLMEEEQRAFRQDHQLSFQQACQILEVPLHTNLDEAKQAWKKKMKACHPDLFVNASTQEQQKAHQQAQRVNQAFQLLKLRLS